MIIVSSSYNIYSTKIEFLCLRFDKRGLLLFTETETQNTYKINCLNRRKLSQINLIISPSGRTRALQIQMRFTLTHHAIGKLVDFITTEESALTFSADPFDLPSWRSSPHSLPQQRHHQHLHHQFQNPGTSFLSNFSFSSSS